VGEQHGGSSCAASALRTKAWVSTAVPYAVAPLVNGGIQVEWRGGGLAEVEVQPNTTYAYLLMSPGPEQAVLDKRDSAEAAEVEQVVARVGFVIDWPAPTSLARDHASPVQSVPEPERRLIRAAERMHVSPLPAPTV
jgi:hypothetical protein